MNYETTESYTRQVLNDMIAEGNAPYEVNYALCGTHADQVLTLVNAYTMGGTEQVREVWGVMTQTDAGLAAFVASNPLPESRFQVHWAREAFGPEVPIDWVIDGIFSAGSVSVLVGEPGSKKTWLMLDAAVAVANGDDWLGHPTRQMTTLVIDEESGVARLNRRLSTLMRGHDVD
jgi:hypothetical protein